MYKIKNTPKDKKDVEFSHYIVFVRKDNFLPVKAEYYNDSDELIRSIEALEVKDVQGFPTVTKSIAKDLVRNGETTMEFSGVEYDVGIGDDIFTERY